jgi:hypothetical protein
MDFENLHSKLWHSARITASTITASPSLPELAQAASPSFE